MKNKKSITETPTLKNLTPLSRKQLQTITGGDDPTLSRGTKTSAAT